MVTTLFTQLQLPPHHTHPSASYIYVRVYILSTSVCHVPQSTLNFALYFRVIVHIHISEKCLYVESHREILPALYYYT